MTRWLAGCAIAALAMSATPAQAQAQAPRMSVGTFLTKVDALKKKGMMAMFSPDVKLIKAEMRSAGMQLKAEGDARKAAGKPPIACPPTDPKARKMGSGEFLKALESIPPAERGMSLKDGLARVIVTKYPCRKG